jgi:hypothetical protein
MVLLLALNKNGLCIILKLLHNPNGILICLIYLYDKIIR